MNINQFRILTISAGIKLTETVKTTISGKKCDVKAEVKIQPLPPLRTGGRGWTKNEFTWVILISARKYR